MPPLDSLEKHGDHRSKLAARILFGESTCQDAGRRERIDNKVTTIVQHRDRNSVDHLVLSWAAKRTPTTKGPGRRFSGC